MVATVEQARKELAKRAAVAELARRGVPLTAPDPSLGQRIGTDLQAREQKIQESRQAFQTGDVSFPETALRQVTQPLGAGFDIGGELARAGFEALPPQIQDPLRATGQFIGERVIDPAIQAVGQLPSIGGGTIGETIPAELAANPRLANVLEDLGLGAAALAPIKRPPVPTRVTPFGRVGEAITDIGERQAVTQKSGFAADLVAPIETTKFLEEASAAGRLSEEGLRRTRTAAPTSREINSAGIVEQLDINPNRSFTFNNNKVIGGIDQRAKQLIKDLDALNVFFPKNEVKRALSAQADTLTGKNPFLQGNPQLTVDKVRNLMSEIIDQNLSTPAGLLKARKEIDATLKAQTQTKSGATILDAPADRAINAAIRDMRQVINNIIVEKAPSVNVRQSLGEQSLLFEARDTIKMKAAREGVDAIERLVNEIEGKVKLKIGVIGRIFGIAGATTEVAAGKTSGLIRGPKAKIALGQLLRATDIAIRKERDAGIIKQLRADRAVVLELFKEEGGK